eukprot:1521380-Pyramimonas_sp.AAC.1
MKVPQLNMNFPELFLKEADGGWVTAVRRPMLLPSARRLSSRFSRPRAALYNLHVSRVPHV